MGYLPVAPATWASAATALGLWFLLPRFGLLPFALLTLAVAAAAVPVCGAAEKTLGHDAHPIVLDEVAGMMVTLCGVPGTAPEDGSHVLILVLGFVLFRIFDVLKPPPVARSQELPGGLGVVVDDVLAGLYSNLVLQILARVWRGA